MADSRLLKLLAMVLSSSIVSSALSLGYSNIVSANTLVDFENENPSTANMFRSVEDHSYTAEIRTTATWSGHANHEITFTNTGNETIHDWYFTFDFNYNIEKLARTKPLDYLKKLCLRLLVPYVWMQLLSMCLRFLQKTVIQHT